VCVLSFLSLSSLFDKKGSINSEVARDQKGIVSVFVSGVAETLDFSRLMQQTAVSKHFTFNLKFMNKLPYRDRNNLTRGGMQKLGLSYTACNPPLFQHDHEDISVRLLAIKL
jgi:hypothetical protein